MSAEVNWRSYVIVDQTDVVNYILMCCREGVEDSEIEGPVSLTDFDAMMEDAGSYTNLEGRIVSREEVYADIATLKREIETLCTSRRTITDQASEAIREINLRIDELEALASEPEPAQVSKWYLVHEKLATLLKFHNQPTFSIGNSHWWGWSQFSKAFTEKLDGAMKT